MSGNYGVLSLELSKTIEKSVRGSIRAMDGANDRELDVENPTIGNGIYLKFDPELLNGRHPSLESAQGALSLHRTY